MDEVQMRNSNSIKISSVRASDNQLQVELDISEEISKYFFKNSFEVTYDKNIEDVDESILAIPAVCAIVQIAWATGADLYVEKLDETFLSSILKIRKVFERFYPKFSSSGNIHVKKIIANKFNNKRTSLFFTSGLDSLDSYKRNKDENPILITLLRVDSSNHLVKIDNGLRKFNQKFADQEGREIHFIRSSFWNFERNENLNVKLLNSDFELINWWADVAQGFIALGFLAPLAVSRIGKVLVASTYPKNDHQHLSSWHFLVYNDFSWADIDVFYDGGLTRQEKIQFLKSTPQYLQNLLVCFTPVQSPNLRNCGHCVKCVRTITGLILEGIDPNECNFNVKNNVFDEIKDLLSGFRYLFTRRHLFPNIQKYIPDTINENEVTRRYHAKQFF